MSPRLLGFKPGVMVFIPSPAIPRALGCEPIYMGYDEYEAFRLTYYEKLNQEEAAKRMGVSRGTLWRCLESARDKIARMLVEHRPLIVTSETPPDGGNPP